MYHKIEKMTPGIIFEYNNEKWIRLGCSHQVIYQPTFIDIHIAKNYHSNQCPTSDIFFQFIAYRKKHVPFYFDTEYEQPDNLNLTLNAKWSERVWLFLMKKPTHIQQEFDKYAAFGPVIERKIQKSFNTVLIGYIKEIEKNNNIEIPLVINSIIKKYIKVGTSVFYCKGFQQPSFGIIDNKIIQQDWLSF